jgi:hypothetical protein
MLSFAIDQTLTTATAVHQDSLESQGEAHVSDSEANSCNTASHHADSKQLSWLLLSAEEKEG